MSKHKVIVGMGDKHFEPKTVVTRAQFATMLVKTLDIPTTDLTKDIFADVNEINWC